VDRWAGPERGKVPPLQGLAAPLGAYAVPGNHDRHLGKERMARFLAENGVELLVNRSVRLEKNGRHFWLIGLDDPLTANPDLTRAMATVPPGDLKILLVHAPDFAPRAAHAGIQLQLSGHSHGGQVRLPGIGALYCPPLGRAYPLSLREVPGSGTLVYTNRGLGTTGVPFRLFCPPEVAVLTLRAEKSSHPDRGQGDQTYRARDEGHGPPPGGRRPAPGVRVSFSSAATRILLSQQQTPKIGSDYPGGRLKLGQNPPQCHG